MRLAYRWWKTSDDKTAPSYTIDRGDFLRPVAPGDSAAITVAVTAPAEPGSYRLQLDLVQEMVAWFEDKGAPRLVIPVRVTQ